MKLDIGCGGRGTMYEGFIGVDIHPMPSNPRKEDQIYMQMDFIKETVPWNPNSIATIVCFHMIEHISRADGVVLLRKIYRLLKPGAKAYVSCPDSKLFIEKYLARDSTFFNRVHPKNNRPIWEGKTLMDKLFFSMYDERSFGHRTPYDLETLFDAAQEAGCTNVKELLKDHYWCRRPDHETGIIITK